MPPADATPASPRTEAASEFSLASARRLVSDLYGRRPWIYWTDFLLSLVVGYAAAAVYLRAAPFSPLQGVAWLVAGFALFRVGSFIHEIVHFRQGEMTAFKVAWNLLAGIPMLMPSSFYENHIDHHNNEHYGTHRDGEYLPLGSGPVGQIGWFFAQVLLLPLLAVARFALLAPLSLLHSGLRRWVRERASSYVINPDYRRPQWGERRGAIWGWVEAACCARALVIPGLVVLGVSGPQRLLALYCLAVLVLGLNYVRNLVAHRYRSHGAPGSHGDQLRDSITIIGGWLTELFFPLALRYHALHHLFPGLPYHNLAAAHRRLMAGLPADSDYHQTVLPSYWSAVRKLVQSARQACREQPTGADRWYARRGVPAGDAVAPLASRQGA